MKYRVKRQLNHKENVMPESKAMIDNGYEVLKDTTEADAMARAKQRMGAIVNNTQGDIYRFANNRGRSAINNPAFDCPEQESFSD